MYIKLNKKKKFSPFGGCILSVIWDSVWKTLLQTALDEILIAGSQYLMLIGTARLCASVWPVNELPFVLSCQEETEWEGVD